MLYAQKTLKTSREIFSAECHICGHIMKETDEIFREIFMKQSTNKYR